MLSNTFACQISPGWRPRVFEMFPHNRSYSLPPRTEGMSTSLVSQTIMVNYCIRKINEMISKPQKV